MAHALGRCSIPRSSVSEKSFTCFRVVVVYVVIERCKGAYCTRELPAGAASLLFFYGSRIPRIPRVFNGKSTFDMSGNFKRNN